MRSERDVLIESVESVESGKTISLNEYDTALTELEPLLYEQKFDVAEKIFKQLENIKPIPLSRKHSFLVRAQMSMGKNPLVLPWLLKQGIPTHCDGYRPLAFFIDGDGLAAIPILKTYGVNLDKTDIRGLSALTLNIRRHCFGVADALFEADVRGVQMEAISSTKYVRLTPEEVRIGRLNMPLLHALIQHGDVQVVETMLEKLLTIKNVREGINQVDQDGKSIMHYITGEQRILIALLKKNDADLDQVDNLGNSPLTHHVYESHLKMAQEFLKQGAKVVQGRYREVKDGVKSNILLLNSLIQRGDKKGVEEILPALLTIKEVRDTINESDKSGNTPLHYAVQRLGVSSVDLLVSSGADIFKENKYGLKPSDVARESTHLKSLRYLEKKEEGTDRKVFCRGHQLGDYFLGGSVVNCSQVDGLGKPGPSLLRQQNGDDVSDRHQDQLLTFSNASVVLALFFVAYIMNRCCNRRVLRSFGEECYGKEKEDPEIMSV